MRLGRDAGRIRGCSRAEFLLGALFVVSLFVALHDVGYALRTPFWVDETWVAVSTRYPVTLSPQLTASTPLGWTLMLRVTSWLPFGGPQRLRLLPLAFSVAAIALAYVLVRTLGWSHRWWARSAGALAAVAVALAPASLVRNDLKQYTADAAFGLVVLILLARAERSTSRRRLALLAFVIGISFFFSAAAGLVGLAALVSLLIIASRRQDRADLWRTLIWTGGCVIVLVAIYLVSYRPGIPAGLHQYWADYELPVGQGFEAVRNYLQVRGGQIARDLGAGRLSVALVAVGAGIVTCWRLGHRAVALVPLVLMGELIGLGASRSYPLFDERTSTFFIDILAVFAALGVMGLGRALARTSRPGAALVVLMLLGLFIGQSQPYWRSHDIPQEDLRTPTDYVSAHRLPGDVVLLGALSSWGYAYYSPGEGMLGRQRDAANLQGYVVDFRDDPRAVVASDRTLPAIVAALDRARALAGSHQIWVIRDHMSPAETLDWALALASGGSGVRVVLGSRLLLL